MNLSKKRVASFLMAMVMVLSLLPMAAFAANAAPTYEFGPDKTVLEPGTYKLPISMMNASKHDNPSMAADCVKGGELVVQEDGSAVVNVQLGVKKMGAMEGWSSQWQIYNEYNTTSALTDCDVVAQDEAGHDTEISFTLPYHDKDGVYAKMYVAVVSMNPDAFLKLDFANAERVAPAPEVKSGTANVCFHGDTVAYTVGAEVSVLDGKITGTALTYDADKVGGSKSYADSAVAGMKDAFNGLSSTDKAAIEAVDTVSGATVTSGAYKDAVLDALGLYQPPKPADLTFGSANTELEPGTYNVPIALRNASKHENPSNAASAFPAMGQLTVAEDGTATLTTAMQPVTIGPITDMAYDVLVYQEDNFNAKTVAAKVVESMKKPESMPGPGKDVPTKISFTVPNNDWDGVYLNFTVDAMGPGYPDAWLQLDYANAKTPGAAEHFNGSAKVNQFGKYTIHTDVTVQDGVIANVAVTADNFISDTHKPTNEMKIAQVTDALKSTWNGMAPTQENAEKIFKAIMDPQDPDSVIDTVSGATYSAKAVRDAVMDAFKLEYQDEVINVPESVEPGVYEVEIGYYSDVVWHSLVENPKTKAKLTVNADKTMVLDFDTKSGTEKEPLYILGFNGIYPNNDTTQALTKEGCTAVMGLSSNDYEDENFAKGTQVVNHLTFPLEGGLSKTYTTNCYLYVPAMKRLNGEMSGVFFENGKFNVDIFAKVYWDSMKKIGDVPGGEDKPEITEGTWSVPVKMLNATHPEKDSMGNQALDGNATVTVGKDKVEYTINVKGIEFAGKYGHLLKMWHYPDFEANSDSITGVVEAAPSNPYMDTNLNGEQSEFYKTFTVTRDGSAEEDQFYIRISVDAMAGFDQDALLSFDWNNAVEAEPPAPEKPEIPEGTWSVPVKMLNATHPEKDSMGNQALDGNATVTVGKDKVEYTINVKGIEFAGKYGHLLKMWHYPDFEANSDSITGVVEAAPSNPYMDTNLNGEQSEFYKTFTVTRDGSAAEDQFYIRISVDAMAGFDQDALLSFDWDNAVKAMPAMNFEDVQKDDWFYPSVEYVYQNGMMNGITDTLFKPNANTTRAQIVTILYRLENEPEAKACDFTDVKPGQWFFEEVSWASANGIVNGYPDGSFAPDKAISREQMAAILYRYAEFKGYDLTADANLSEFVDAGQINNYAKTAMNWAVTQDLVNGVGGNRIAPKGQATRAQVATLFMRFNETFVK